MLRVSRSGYYQFIQEKPSKRRQENERLLFQIKQIHAESRQIYGSPRIWAELRARGESCSRKRVCRLMKRSFIAAKMKKRFKITTRANAEAIVAPNLLQQKFTASRLNQHWVADLTSISTSEGWLYVAVILDLFSRSIVGMAMKERMNTDLVVTNTISCIGLPHTFLCSPISSCLSGNRPCISILSQGVDFLLILCFDQQTLTKYPKG